MNSTHRPAGVMTPAGQLNVNAPGTPKTVRHFSEVRTFAVEYLDEQGLPHTTLLQSIGGVWHLAPNGENYAATLRALSKDSWLSKMLEERVSHLDTSKIPKTDSVDVLEDEEG